MKDKLLETLLALRIICWCKNLPDHVLQVNRDIKQHQRNKTGAA